MYVQDVYVQVLLREHNCSKLVTRHQDVVQYEIAKITSYSYDLLYGVIFAAIYITVRIPELLYLYSGHYIFIVLYFIILSS